MGAREGPRTRLAIVVLGLLLLNAWEWIFGAFFPTRNGTLGNDWGHKLPLLLDGYGWLLQNGWLSLPWYTPSFCGGIPLFAHPASFYVSLPQLLTFFTDPLTAAHVALLVFAAAGLAGTYALARRVYGVGAWPALLGGGLFLMNGFYAHRMLIGHLEFHGFMLTPLLAVLALGGEASRARRSAAEVLGAAAILAYLFLAGATQLVFPIVLALVALWLLAGLVRPDFRMRAFPQRIAVAGVLALAVGASKLVASLAILSNFPRDFYPMPGIDGPLAALRLALVALAWNGRAVDLGAVVDSEFPPQPHEFEYGVTPIPFLLLAVWAAVAVHSRLRGAEPRPGGRRRLLLGVALALVLALPIVLNISAVARSLAGEPLFRSLSNLVRWLAMLIPVLAVAASLAVERVEALRLRERWLVPAALVLVVALNALSDRAYYEDQIYPPDAIVLASRLVRARGAPTPIRSIEATIEDGEIVLSINRNDVLVRGASQLACYEPLFGFRLERFPRKALHPGPVLEAQDGRLNLKNPACYVYPEENGCEPGDPFRTDQIEQARRFASFRPFHWERSRAQRIADVVSPAALALCVAAAAGLGAAELRARRGRPRRRD